MLSETDESEWKTVGVGTLKVAEIKVCVESNKSK